MRRKLDDDHQSYKRKLAHYQDSQQRQAEVVNKLQQKVTQFKTKCNELELVVESKNAEVERLKVNRRKENLNSADVDSLANKLDEEQQKYLKHRSYII